MQHPVSTESLYMLYRLLLFGEVNDEEHGCATREAYRLGGQNAECCVLYREEQSCYSASYDAEKNTPKL